MTLCETGTRALLGAVFGSAAQGELAWARKLLHRLDASMLVLMDRGFDAAGFLAEVDATGARFLVRLNSARRPPVLRRLADGSVLSLIGGVTVRIIAANGHGHLRGRHHLRRVLPAGHYPGRSPRLARRRPDRAVPRALGTRDRLPRAAAHPAPGPGPALP